MRLVFATVLLVAALPVTAQIYQYTDAKGNTIFTDQPPMGVDTNTVELQSTNSLPAPARSKPKASSNINADTDSEEIEAAEHITRYSLLKLSGLPDDEAVRTNNGSFTVQVQISPELASQHRLQLVVDGKPYGTASSSSSVSVENLERGEHRLAVQVLIDNNKVMQSSAEQTISVQRVHITRPKP